MATTVHCITLPVEDLSASLAFYRDILGLPVQGIPELTPETDHLPIQVPGGLYLTLILRRDFDAFIAELQLETAPRGVCETILTYFAPSPAEVDAIAQRAQAAGHTAQTPRSRDWGYAAFLTDPDGHFWEVVHNPAMTAAQQAGQA